MTLLDTISRVVEKVPDIIQILLDVVKNFLPNLLRIVKSLTDLIVESILFLIDVILNNKPAIEWGITMVPVIPLIYILYHFINDL